MHETYGTYDGAYLVYEESSYLFPGDPDRTYFIFSRFNVEHRLGTYHLEVRLYAEHSDDGREYEIAAIRTNDFMIMDAVVENSKYPGKWTNSQESKFNN